MSINHQSDLFDLPNEILLIIFNKLHMTDVLYSLVGLTEWLDQLVFDPLYIRNLNMTSMTMKSFHDRIYSIDSRVLDRICKSILPQISHKISEIIVEQYSMNRVLNVINYPELYSLKLVDFSEEVLLNELTNNTIFRQLLHQQITCLTIDIKDQPTEPSSEALWLILTSVVSLCKQLKKLSIGQFDYRTTICTFDFSSTNFKSSILTQLIINLESFNDCLYLLDGRFRCLSTLIVNIDIISSTSETIDNTETLSKLKHFSLTSYPHTFLYDDVIIPLLRRMINLEELILDLSIIRSNKNYVDGIQLYDDILIHMPQMNKFTFNLYTNVDKNNVGINFSSKKDVQRSFRRKEYYGPVASHIEVFNSLNERACHNYSLPFEFQSRCHIYSLPYHFKTYHFLTNSFQGGIFTNVQSLVMGDCCSFEHNFFQIISQSFPSLKMLHIMNKKPQKDKQKSLPLIQFPYLIYLYLRGAHADYAEQFLVDKFCHVPCLLSLNIDYESLILITNNFTNDATRLTCSKFTSLRTNESFVPPKNFHQYFPLL
ncbi:unnamed protein product [Adineta ricciae]|uniref:F-box domain-containing protein n=1 Tax=Adineta ricciae TaxID=249248 RepID=A0A815ITH4_ADIRI|nr:unnamed protein product [Adineta ricciae]CAF1370825.1 unnamed protein product [Adineta ricciae]